jgi:hypothetical protein
MNEKRNSIVILAKNINMDKEYQNIIDYSESDLVSLLRSSDHLVMEQNNYSFLKVGENRISVGIPYAVCLRANYIAIQNPYYSNKWFFAFIDNVEYSSEKSTIISYTVDEISTWWSYWTKKVCYVEREHVNDDTVGLHTIPEGLETGDYICNDSTSTVFNEYAYLLNASKLTSGADAYATNVNGIWMSGGFYVFDNITSLISVLNLYNGSDPTLDLTIDAVKNVYIVPKFLLNTEQYNTRWNGTNTPVYVNATVNKLTTLNGYTPKNKKLLCYPYNYLLETNNNGSSNIFKYELFSSNPSFSIGGCATVGSSIVSIPNNYNSGNEPNMLNAGKFPTCSWSEDAYTNWLTQNSVNVLGQTIDPVTAGYGIAGIQALAGVGMIASGNPVGGNLIGSAISSAFQTAQAVHEHEIVPNSFRGNINGGDYLTASGHNGFYFYRMSIKREMAESIDAFFTRFGYKVNALKVPNFTGRKYWNFVKIAGGEIVGYANNNTVNVPESSMDIINKIFRNGTTIWHNHDNIGNYNLDNVIE